jgi:hypothetical protein
MMDLALYYASRRWPVFPLATGSKLPAIAKTRGGHGCLDATLNATQIEAWWSEFPEANIGIATGRRSGLLVIDVDPRKTPDWLASVNQLRLPQTFTVRTASSGFHLYFVLPDGAKISIGADLLPGIDWRGNGGYVVGAGSVVGGVTYEIVRNVAMLPAPVTLLDRIATHGKRARIAARDPDSGHMVIPDGRRNDQLFRIGCALRRFGIDYNALAAALCAVNADHCNPPVPETEVRAIVASAMRYAPDDSACAKEPTS